jgi:hypothetical protein
MGNTTSCCSDCGSGSWSRPGLWIHVEALLAGDARQMLATVEQGLATPEHAEFLQRLAAQRRAS